MKLNAGQLQTLSTMFQLADEDDVTVLVDMLKDRRQVLRSQKVMSLAPGDRVRLGGRIKPKYLAGRVVEIHRIGTKSVYADTREAFAGTRYAQANCRIPISCVEQVM